MPSKILIVDDEPSILNVLKTLLSVEGFEVTAISDGNQAVSAIEKDDFDLMISDIRMTPINGMELLRIAYEKKPGMSVIMVTAFGSVDTAVEAVRMGAYDYITKPFKIDELLLTVQRALEYKRTMSENVDLKAQLVDLNRFEDIVAESPAMKTVCEMIKHVGPTNTTILLCGEKGTGKALIAKAVHTHSSRKAREFVAIDCSEMPEEVQIATCIGDGQGKEGAFAKASGGTMFIGEIGALVPGLQEILFHVIENKVAPTAVAGGSVEADIRLVVGTSVDLDKLVSEGRLRQDLYQKISVIPIRIRPLRERREDIMPLVAHILEGKLGEGEDLPGLEPEAREALLRYSWPGNVEELAFALGEALPKAQDGKIVKDSFSETIAQAASQPGGATLIKKDDQRGKSLKNFLKAKEKEYVKQVLSHTGGDKTKAAKALDISLATLYRKLPEKEFPENKGDSHT